MFYSSCQKFVKNYAYFENEREMSRYVGLLSRNDHHQAPTVCPVISTTFYRLYRFESKKKKIPI